MVGFGVWEFLIMIPVLILVVLPFWKIFSKAGYSGWYFAFSKWPIYKSISKIDNIDKKSKTRSGKSSKVNFSEEDKPTW